MKLAFCLFKYFPFGGLQRDFLRIVKECIRRGHQVDVFTMEWEGDPEPGISLHIIPSQGFQNHTRSQNFVEHVSVKIKSYDLVIGFNKMPGLDIYYAADTCYQAKARRQRGFWYRLTARYRHLIASEKAIFANTSKTEILLLSKLQQADFIRIYHTEGKRFYLLPPGITPDRVASANRLELRQQMRHEWSLSQDEFLLLMVGSGFKTKGLDRILLGLAGLPDALKKRTSLYVIGKDNPRSFQHQAQKLGIIDRVKFLGGRSDVPRFMCAADLLLHPAYNENTGTVLLEALASGLPVLTTDVCGYAEYVRQAVAGVVLAAPFEQIQFNQTLANMLLSEKRTEWQKNALIFTKNADIYSLPERAVDRIEAIGHAKDKGKKDC